MFRWKKWAGLMGVAALVVVLVAMAGTAGTTGVTPVADDEGTQVQGGASGCSNYSNTFIKCGSGKCQGQPKTCPTQNKLWSGSGVSAKNVTTLDPASCIVCGSANTCGTALNISTWDPCQ
jgi:hypothetical protein